MDTPEAILRAFESPPMGLSMDPVNIVDAIVWLSEALSGIRDAIKPSDAMASKDDAGGVVNSLTEAVMGHTSAMIQIADAIDNLAEAVRAKGD